MLQIKGNIGSSDPQCACHSLSASVKVSDAPARSIALLTGVLHVGQSTAQATNAPEHAWQVHLWPQGWNITMASAAQHTTHSAGSTVLADAASALL